jgi:hypothetical protein
MDTFARAKNRVDQLLSEYCLPNNPPEMVTELHNIVTHLARDAGMDQLPPLEGYE